MHNTIKGALAAGTAGLLLIGGAGTLAYWSDTEDVGTDDITSGSISLSTPDCTTDPVAGTHGWQLDDDAAFTPGTTDLVPGDSISKVCDMTLAVVGEHIGATLVMDAADLVDDETTTLDSELTATASFLVDGATYEEITAPGEYDVRATVTVTFDGPNATNGSQTGDVDLDAINLLATQTHS